MRSLLPCTNLAPLRKILLPQQSTIRDQGLKKRQFYLNKTVSYLAVTSENVSQISPSPSPLPFILFFLNKQLFKNKFTYLFIYFWLCWVFVAACRLSLVAASGGCSLLWCADFSLQWLLLLRSTGSRRGGFSSCDTRAQ